MLSHVDIVVRLLTLYNVKFLSFHAVKRGCPIKKFDLSCLSQPMMNLIVFVLSIKVAAVVRWLSSLKLKAKKRSFLRMHSILWTCLNLKQMTPVSAQTDWSDECLQAVRYLHFYLKPAAIIKMTQILNIMSAALEIFCQYQ